jgi:hypothetical protein
MRFTLTVYDFGITYVGEQHNRHLMDILKLYYRMEADWTGGLYCGIILK